MTNIRKDLIDEYALVDWSKAPAMLRIDEAAKLLGIGKKQLYQKAQCKGFPVVIFGRRKVIPRDALMEWIYAQAFSF
ncbi:MAG: helix-turn-helix domain-containing protein [Acidobacteriota bacterium]